VLPADAVLMRGHVKKSQKRSEQSLT